MDYNQIEEEKQKLERLLLGEGGFFEHMSDEQKDAFGEAIKLIARLQVYELLGEVGKNGFSVGLNLDNFNIGEMLKNLIVVKPNTPSMGYEMPPSYCGNCHQDPCMCSTESVNGDPTTQQFYDCVNCGLTPCVCEPEYKDENQMELPLSTDTTYNDPAMMVEDSELSEDDKDGVGMEYPMSGDTMGGDTA